MIKKLTNIEQLYGPKENWFINLELPSFTCTVYIQNADESSDYYENYTDETLIKADHLNIGNCNLWVSVPQRPTSARVSISDKTWDNRLKKFKKELKNSTVENLTYFQFAF